MQTAGETGAGNDRQAQAQGSVGRTMVTAPLSWVERLWSSIADRGQDYAEVLHPKEDKTPLDLAKDYARALLTERGDASAAAVARELLAVMSRLGTEEEMEFCRFLSENFHPDIGVLREAAERYLKNPSPDQAAKLAAAAEPLRQELIRRMNMAPGGTAALVQMRGNMLSHPGEETALAPLNADLRHLFASWFNRGFLELRRIGWETPAAMLEKLIAYEAVHAIDGWEDLRRRLAPDRRCFGFFHPALPGEPLIFVEVALTSGLAASVQPLLERTDDAALQRENERNADTAIFYSISNCQEGLKGISLGNFLIKQVVEELKAELPGLKRFSTLSPIPGFRRWLEARLTEEAPDILLRDNEEAALRSAFNMQEQGGQAALLARALQTHHWWHEPVLSEALRHPLTRLCAAYLVTFSDGKIVLDPVARFHLSNGARLERVNWQGNIAPRGIKESYGLMVNYLYEPDKIEANHEMLVRGNVVRSPSVDTLLGTPSVVVPLSQDNNRNRKKAAR